MFSWWRGLPEPRFRRHRGQRARHSFPRWCGVDHHEPRRDARLESLAKMEAQVLALEREMGTTHPHVGKAWLALSRAYQKMASPSHNKRAERALVR